MKNTHVVIEEQQSMDGVCIMSYEDYKSSNCQRTILFTGTFEECDKWRSKYTPDNPYYVNEKLENMNIEEFFKAGYKLSNMEKIRILKVTIDNVPSEWKEENTTGFFIYEGLEIMLQEIIADEYTEVDDIWPSRYWNSDKTDYLDFSG